MRTAIALLVLLLPASAQAKAYVGTVSGTFSCASTGPAKVAKEPFVLNMDLGSSDGTLAIFGGSSRVLTDTVPTRSGHQFSASVGIEAGLWALSGKISKKGKLRGNLIFHAYDDGPCFFHGKAKAR